MKRRILVTGTTGYLGGEFIKFINKERKFLITELIRSDKKKSFNKSINENKKIFYKHLNEIHKKLAKKKFEYFVHFAAFYKNTHDTNDIFKFNEANILLPTLILNTINLKLKKFISFGTMMEYSNKKYSPQNFYASTKRSFEAISKYYQLKNKSCKFYNIKIFDTFDFNDHRKKIIPVILKKFDQNKEIELSHRNLKMNIIRPLHLNNFILKLLKNNFQSQNIIIKNTKNLSIFKLIKLIEKFKNKKIKLKIKNKSKNFNILNKYDGSKIINIKDDIEKYIIKNL